MPGTAPARNILPTEMPDSAPTMIIGTEGGMMGPTVDEAAVTRRREIGRIAGLLHPRYQHAADRCRVGNRGTGDAAEQHRTGDIGEAETAPCPADECIRKAHDALGDAASVHQVAGKNEAGNAQQYEDIDAGVHLLWNHDERNPDSQQIGHRSQSQRHGNRDADNKAADEDADENGKAHSEPPYGCSGRPSDRPSSMFATRVREKTNSEAISTKTLTWMKSMRQPSVGDVCNAPIEVKVQAAYQKHQAQERCGDGGDQTQPPGPASPRSASQTMSTLTRSPVRKDSHDAECRQKEQGKAG